METKIQSSKETAKTSFYSIIFVQHSARQGKYFFAKEDPDYGREDDQLGTRGGGGSAGGGDRKVKIYASSFHGSRDLYFWFFERSCSINTFFVPSPVPATARVSTADAETQISAEDANLFMFDQEVIKHGKLVKISTQ